MSIGDSNVTTEKAGIKKHIETARLSSGAYRSCVSLLQINGLIFT